MGSLITADTWRRLGETTGQSQGLVRTRIAPDSPVDIFVAVEKPLNLRVLSIGFRGEDLDEIAQVPQARGVEIKLTSDAGGTRPTGITLRPASPRFSEVFTVLADDVATVAAAATSQVAALAALTSRLRRWEAFLALADDQGLGEERRAGLYGELHVMASALLPALGKSGAVDSWRGPFGAAQDFQGEGWAVEVKTSRMKEPSSLRIASERQLDDRGLESLYLAHVALDQRHQSGQTLPALIAVLRDALAADAIAAEVFEDRLTRAGYVDAQAHLYKDAGYTVREAAVFRVADHFPRLLFDDLDAGLGDVHYSVTVAACRPFQVGWDEMKVPPENHAHSQ